MQKKYKYSCLLCEWMIRISSGFSLFTFFSCEKCVWKYSHLVKRNLRRMSPITLILLAGWNYIICWRRVSISLFSDFKQFILISSVEWMNSDTSDTTIIYLIFEFVGQMWVIWFHNTQMPLLEWSPIDVRYSLFELAAHIHIISTQTIVKLFLFLVTFKKPTSHLFTVLIKANLENIINKIIGKLNFFFWKSIKNNKFNQERLFFFLELKREMSKQLNFILYM